MQFNCVVTIDSLSERILVYLADRYAPVHSDWVETADVAAAFQVRSADIDARCRVLAASGLVELAAPDDENPSYAAIVTTKGLLAIGRLP